MQTQPFAFCEMKILIKPITAVGFRQGMLYLATYWPHIYPNYLPLDHIILTFYFY